MNAKTILLLFAWISFSLLSCKKESELITPEQISITESVYATGYVKSLGQYEVVGRANGVIEKIFVKEGIPVKKGDPIFQLYRDDLGLRTENARLALSAAEYENNLNKLSDAKRTIELAQKNLHSDSLQFERQKKLWSQNIGSKLQLEQKELTYENSKGELARAETNYFDLKRQLMLLSEQSRNNLGIAQLLEEDHLVRSEVDGVVYKLNKEEGELIGGLEPVAIIGSEEFRVELNVDEMDIVKIKKGQQVLLRMDSYGSQVFEASIVAIDPMMNMRTRSFRVEAAFTLKPEQLFPNLTVEANIVIQTKKDALTIPRKYLIDDSYVMLKGGELQRVQTGLMDYEFVEIVSGIDKTTQIDLPQK